ncbi:MAG: formyltetrahydrofolate deformylase [Actinomycetota bacterium]|nr:formyltetrahydrofolate deformylase [Actinomycetota bacterium]
MSGRSATHLLISCADRPGIVAAVSRFLYEQGANIVEADQYATEAEGGTFYMRMAFQLEGTSADDFEHLFATEVAEPLEMEWRLSYPDEPRRVAVLVSREDHCLLDLLWRARRGDFEGEIVHVISNHPDHEPDVATFDVPFTHVPVKDDQRSAEGEMLDLLAGKVELVVLARYMRILSGEFLEGAGVPFINIHHSFLPAFPGAEPYARAAQRGVKIIGATAHYVTEALDEGPIIEQDVTRVSHRHSTGELAAIGRDIERIVLARAVRWHLQDRVIVHENRTVVF